MQKWRNLKIGGDSKLKIFLKMLNLNKI